MGYKEGWSNTGALRFIQHSRTFMVERSILLHFLFNIENEKHDFYKIKVTGMNETVAFIHNTFLVATKLSRDLCGYISPASLLPPA